MKQRELANLCCGTINEVKEFAGRRLKSMQRRVASVASFWKQSGLAF
jgi:hypothetical protein